MDIPSFTIELYPAENSAVKAALESLEVIEAMLLRGLLVDEEGLAILRDFALADGGQEKLAHLGAISLCRYRLSQYYHQHSHLRYKIPDGHIQSFILAAQSLAWRSVDLNPPGPQKPSGAG